MPHGHCYLWTPAIVWLHVISDALIVIAYYSIPVTIVYFVRQRKDLTFSWMFVCFAVFILACGTTHLMEIWNVWHSNYWLSGGFKALTAAASVPTAILLVRLVPGALSLASPEQLQRVNTALQAEIQIRSQAEEQIGRLNLELERRVQERTTELHLANEELQRQIAERQIATEALRTNEADFRASFDSPAVGQAQVEPATGRYLRVNRQFCEIAGYSEKELLGMTFRDLTHPDDRVNDSAAHEQLVNQEVEGLDREKRYLRKDGRTAWVHIMASIIRDGAGHPLRTLAVVQDITERKRSEEKTAWLASFPELNPYPIIEADLDAGRVSYANPVARRLFPDLARNELQHPWTAGLREFAQPLVRGETEVMHREIALESAYYSQTMSYLPKPSRVRIYGADITERRQAEDAVRKMNADLENRVAERTAELEAANKELEAFSYSISHDLRAPLRAVDGFSQAVLEDYEALLPESGQRYLRTIRRGAQSMGMLIDDLLAFSRLSRAALTKRDINVLQLVGETLEELSPQIMGRTVDVRIGDLPPCQGDPALLKQVWINLLSNAFKYSRHTATAVVEIGADLDERGAAYYVRDNGAGFDMRYADKLFGVFQRLHRADEFEGTGVGLAIVQRIVQRHGGRVWVEAAVDRGATFHFTLHGENQS